LPIFEDESESFLIGRFYDWSLEKATFYDFLLRVTYILLVITDNLIIYKLGRSSSLDFFIQSLDESIVLQLNFYNWGNNYNYTFDLLF